MLDRCLATVHIATTQSRQLACTDSSGTITKQKRPLMIKGSCLCGEVVYELGQPTKSVTYFHHRA